MEIPSYMPAYCSQCCNSGPLTGKNGEIFGWCKVFVHTRKSTHGETREQFTAILGDDGLCRAFNVEWHICPYNWCRRVVFPEDVRRGKQGAVRCVNCVDRSVEELRVSKE